MLTPEQIADGWLAHDGGECPVPLDSMPGVWMRNGAYINPGKFYARRWLRGGTYTWQHSQSFPALDIVAYRPVQP